MIDNIRCDYMGCPYLANKAVKIVDLPDAVIPKVIINPKDGRSWVKICHRHGIGGAKFAFIKHDPELQIRGSGHISSKFSEPLFFKCLRCGYVWKSRWLLPAWRVHVNSNKEYRPNENYGKLPGYCPHCRSKGWATHEPLRPANRGSWKDGQVVPRVRTKK